jgi:hypothetical protein
VIEFLVVNKECVRICGIAIFDRSTIGHWVKRVMGSKMGKAELHDLPCSGHVAQMLVSKLLWVLLKQSVRNGFLYLELIFSQMRGGL